MIITKCLGSKKGIGRFHIIKVTTQPSECADSLIINQRIGQAYSKSNAELIVKALQQEKSGEHFVVTRLLEKIHDMKTKETSDVQEENHGISPRTMLFYLKQIRGDFQPKQECPFDI
jgi:hypothetical protein